MASGPSSACGLDGPETAALGDLIYISVLPQIARWGHAQSGLFVVVERLAQLSGIAIANTMYSLGTLLLTLGLRGAAGLRPGRRLGSPTLLGCFDPCGWDHLPGIVFHGGAEAYGFMSAAMGIGAVIGGLFTAARGRTGLRPMIIASVGFGAAILVCACAPFLGLAYAFVSHHIFRWVVHKLDEEAKADPDPYLEP